MMVVTIEVQANLQWRAVKSTSSDTWIATCDPLNMAMESKSLDELHSLIGETIGLLLTDLLFDNELDRFLQDRGWRARGIPSTPDVRDVRFDVPWELIAENARDSARRAN